MWTISAVSGTAAYAGLYGWLYCADGVPAAVWCAFSFGMLPVVTGAGVLGSYLLSRRGNEDVAVGWPATGLFWWLLPLSLTIGFAFIALFGFSLTAREQPSNGQGEIAAQEREVTKSQRRRRPPRQTRRERLKR